MIKQTASTFGSRSGPRNDLLGAVSARGIAETDVSKFVWSAAPQISNPKTSISTLEGKTPVFPSTTTEGCKLALGAARPEGDVK